MVKNCFDNRKQTSGKTTTPTEIVYVIFHLHNNLKRVLFAATLLVRKLGQKSI